MDTPLPNPASLLPPHWRAPVDAQLNPGETVLFWFEPDLDTRLCFNRGLVLLTDQRLLGTVVEPTRAQPQPVHWESWTLSSEDSLIARHQGGVGALELVGPVSRKTHWHYTEACALAADRFAQRCNALRNPLGSPDETLSHVCPSCGAVVTSEFGECPDCAPSPTPALNSLFRLAKFARSRLPVVLIGLLLSLAATAAALVPPYLTMPLLDKVLVPYQNGKPVEASLIYWYLGGLAGAAVVAWLLEWARTCVLAWASERISADLRNRTYEHLQRLSVEFFGGKRTGDLMSRIGTDTERICDFLTLNLFDFAGDVLMITLTAAILLSIHPLLALVTLCPFPIMVLMVYWVRVRLRQGFRQGGIAWGEMTSVLADTIPGIRVVKAFAQERREVQRFRTANDRVLTANDRINFLWSFFRPLVTLLTDGGLLVVWAFGAWLVFRHQITVGVLTAFLAYITRFYARLEAMIHMVSATQKASASAQRLFEILDRIPSVPEPKRPIHPGRVQGEIELQGLRFKYGTREVLHGLDLTIRPGEMIGLVGPSGAGKSTLINLICRFYDVAQGAILVDGVDIRSYPIEEYRHNIGIVLQEPFLFYGTIAENIAYGLPTASRSEIVAAARAARAHDFIMRLPDGYDSLVGERGQSLSGGERQRISIARALLIDPRILILDEATSSVDTETEREIQAALDNLILGRTTIAIAHRLSTLRKADRLVVLERGRIAEIGNHEDLLELTGTYARLHRAQLELVQGVEA